jgi:hypothetical protein
MHARCASEASREKFGDRRGAVLEHTAEPSEGTEKRARRLRGVGCERHFVAQPQEGSHRRLREQKCASDFVQFVLCGRWPATKPGIEAIDGTESQLRGTRGRIACNHGKLAAENAVHGRMLT